MAGSELPSWIEEEEKKHRPGRKEKYPLRRMKVAEVISMPGDYILPLTYPNFRRFLSNRGSVLKKKFVSRQLEDGTIEVCRVK